MTQDVDAPPGRPDAPLLLLTKLHPPVVPAQAVARERLFERLREGRGRRLSLVACPAGFGKSTLLAAWREAESGERPVAWVTLDEGDNDLVVLWSHVVEALARVCPGLAETGLAAIVPAAPVVEVVLPRLVNELVEQGEVALVLDDFHRLSGAPALESVAWFVDHLPASVQLVVASRTDPALPLGALRAHGELLELRADELRFTGAEAAEFLNERLGLELRTRRGRAARRADRGLARRALPRGALARGQAGQARAGPGVRRHQHARRRLPRRRGARGLRAGPADVHAAHVRARAPVRGAVRRGARAATGRRPPWSRSRARTCSSCRSTRGTAWFRFHHLFAQILRVELERREPALVRGPASPRVRAGTARPARPTRRSTTRSPPACSTRPAG